MNAQLASYLRHIFTAWITTAVIGLTAWFALDEKSAATVTEGFGKIADGVLVVLAVLVPVAMRMLLAWFSKLFRTGAGDDDGQSGGVGTLPLWIVLCTAAALGGLPSCSAPGGMPITWKLYAEDGAVSYSAKRGIEVEVRVEK